MAAAVAPARAPEISFEPNEETYLARVARRVQEPLSKELPPGFPKRLDSRAAWTRDDITDDDNGIYHLNESQVGEIEAALKHFQSLNMPLGYINQETFPLSRSFHEVLRDVSREVHNGRGFKVLRGVPIKLSRDMEENIIITAGVSSHVGPVRGRQDHEIDGQPADVVLHHFKTPAGYVRDKLAYHNEHVDVTLIACLEEAVSGGQAKLASTWAVYNELAETRPDLLKTLAEPWPAENFSAHGPRYTFERLLHHVPASETQPERIILKCDRREYTGYRTRPRASDIPPLTEAQAEALDALHFLGEKHGHSLTVQVGDIRFVNDILLFHAREISKDSPTQQRHLLRVWLHDPEYAWRLPKDLERQWNEIYGGVTEGHSVLPLHTRIRSAHNGKGLHAITLERGESYIEPSTEAS